MGAKLCKCGGEGVCQCRTFEELVGMHITDAEQYCFLAGYICRVQKFNDQEQIGTCDYQRLRVNVAIADNLVTEVYGIG
jgi:hypothetical protein